MEIMTNYKGEQLNNVLIGINNRFIACGRYISHAPLNGSEFSAKAKDYIFENILIIYNRLCELCYDTSYIIDERDTLLDALDKLNPLEYQKLFIMCKHFWEEVNFLPLDKTAIP